MYVRNVHGATVAAILPNHGCEVDPRHPVIAAGLAAGHLVETERPYSIAEAPAQAERLRAENTTLRARVAELEALLETTTAPKLTPKRVAREG